MNKSAWLTALLIYSAGRTLVCIGVAVGRHASEMSSGQHQLEWMMQEISDDSRKKIRASMREHMRATRPARRDLREAQEKLHDAITAQDYDEAEIIERFADVRLAAGVLQASMHEQIVQNLREFKPEERMHVLRMITRHERRGPRNAPPPDG